MDKNAISFAKIDYSGVRLEDFERILYQKPRMEAKKYYFGRQKMLKIPVGLVDGSLTFKNQHVLAQIS